MTTTEIRAPYALAQIAWGEHTISDQDGAKFTGRVVDVIDEGRTIVLYIGHLVGDSGHLFHWRPATVSVQRAEGH